MTRRRDDLVKSLPTALAQTAGNVICELWPDFIFSADECFFDVACALTAAIPPFEILKVHLQTVHLALATSPSHLVIQVKVFDYASTF